MLQHNLPLTREAYIHAAYPFEGPPKPWTAEHEAEVPEPLRDMSQVDQQ